MANSALKAEMSQSTQSGQDTKTDYLVILILAIAGFIVAGLVSLDTGGRGVILFTLGALLGASFLFFQYGFASGWRLLITQGDTRPMGYHFLLVGLCSLVSLPVSFLDLGASGSLAPISISLIMGSFIFGIGMQLANGCGSGVLFTYGGGSARMLFALPGFVIGSVLGSLALPPVLEWGALNPIAIGGRDSLLVSLLTNVSLIFGVMAVCFYLAHKTGRALSKKWLLGTGLIAVLCALVFVISGHPWGVTFGFTVWGGKLALLAGLPIDKAVFWQWPGPALALKQSVFADISSLMNFGMIIGAGLLAAITASFAQQPWPPSRQLIAAIIGGLLMGVGARLAFGCNIGAFLAGISSGSLHGWLWAIFALAGSWIGIKIRPYFGF